MPIPFDRFRNLFPRHKAIIRVLHLSDNHPVERALEDITIYEEEGPAGAILGSTFKPDGNTQRMIDRALVRQFMSAVNDE